MYHIAELFPELGKPMAAVRDDPDNATDGFAEWWAFWPAHDRKAEKRRCLDEWIKKGLARHKTHVMAYTEFSLDTKMYKDDDRAYLPAPLVWLRKEGWIDWQPPPKKQIHIQTNTVQVTEEHKAAATPMPAELRAKLALMRRRPQ